MHVFCWDQNFETGLPEVDKQHRQLIDIVNRFGDLLAQNRLAPNDFDEIFSNLISYTEHHFQEEEGLMASFAIDKRHRDRHIKEHEDFLQEIAFMQQEIGFMQQENNLDDEPGQTLFEFLNNWLAYHLLGSDKCLSLQIAAIEAGQSAEQAYEIETRELNKSTGSLLTALNNLFRQISNRNRQLVEMNQTLEEKVAERTRALSEANRNLEELALTDVLTALPNRRHAMRRLSQLWAESFDKGTPLSCLMIDADHFKAVNDSCGHDAGDLVLRELARRLREAVRSDDIVCRLGGDEFLVICPNTPLEGAMHLAEIARASVGEMKIPVLGGVWHGSISTGVATRTPPMENPDALIKVADEGVYTAKHSGRNCVRASKKNRLRKKPVS